MRALLILAALLPLNPATTDSNPWGHPHHHGQRIAAPQGAEAMRRADRS